MLVMSKIIPRRCTISASEGRRRFGFRILNVRDRPLTDSRPFASASCDICACSLNNLILLASLCGSLSNELFSFEQFIVSIFSMISSLLPMTRQRLKARLGQYPVIVRETGLTYSWLQKFANGRINNPTINSLDRLIQYLDETESSSILTRLNPQAKTTTSAAPKPSIGRWRLDPDPEARAKLKRYAALRGITLDEAVRELYEAMKQNEPRPERPN